MTTDELRELLVDCKDARRENESALGYKDRRINARIKLENLAPFLAAEVLCLREMVEGVSKRAFLAGHWEGWRGNQLSRAVQHVHAKEGWQLYVESNAFEKSLTQADERESGAA